MAKSPLPGAGVGGAVGALAASVQIFENLGVHVK